MIGDKYAVKRTGTGKRPAGWGGGWEWGGLAGWMAGPHTGLLAGWLAGCLAGWLVGQQQHSSLCDVQ